MGGNLFTALNKRASDEAPLEFPRLPTALYLRLQTQVFKILTAHAGFTTAVFPPDPPGKPDHGDIDVLVHSAITPTPKTLQDLPSLVKLLHATQHFNSGGVWNFAIPLISFHQIDSTTYPNLANPQTHLQIDLHVCSTLQELQWRAFKASYGDLWQILDVIIRPYGLTADEKYLNVRIQEVEEGGSDKDAARIRLTGDPDETLRFLGLDVDAFHRGFKTEEEVFRFAISCRLFRTDSFFRPSIADDQITDEVPRDPGNINKNDRHRTKARPMFARFKTWVHAHRDTLARANCILTREEVFDEAITRYDQSQGVEEVLKQHRRAVGDKELRDRVAHLLSEIAKTEILGHRAPGTDDENLSPLIRTDGETAPAELRNAEKQNLERGDAATVAVQETAVKDTLTRLMRGCRSFVKLDAYGMPFVASPEVDDRPIQASQSWIDSAVTSDRFVEWIKDHWREVDEVECRRREEGARKAFEDREAKRKLKSEEN